MNIPYQQPYTNALFPFISQDIEELDARPFGKEYQSAYLADKAIGDPTPQVMIQFNPVTGSYRHRLDYACTIASDDWDNFATVDIYDNINGIVLAQGVYMHRKVDCRSSFSGFVELQLPAGTQDIQVRLTSPNGTKVWIYNAYISIYAISLPI